MTNWLDTLRDAVLSTVKDVGATLRAAWANAEKAFGDGPPDTTIKPCTKGQSSQMSPPLEDVAAEVNPGDGTVNCGQIIDAVIARLRGTNPDAVAPLDRDGSFTEIEARHQTTLDWGRSFDEAFTTVEAGGDGTTAIVGIAYSAGSSSHVIVMTNRNGQVGIIEGQDWGPDYPPEVIYTAERANARYNSDGGSNVGYGLIP